MFIVVLVLLDEANFLITAEVSSLQYRRITIYTEILNDLVVVVGVFQMQGKIMT
jgi:hypothetical protein